MNRSRSIVILALAGFAAACSKPPPAPDPDAFQDMVMSHYVAPYKVGDIATFIEAFAEDAVLLPAHAPVQVGRQAIREHVGQLAETFRFREYLVQVEEIRIQGDWALTRGSYTSMRVYRQSSEPAPGGRDTGKFILLWARQADGQWRIITAMDNSDRPATAAAESKSYEQQLLEDAGRG